MINKELNNNSDIDLLIFKKIDGTITSGEETILKNYFIEHPEEEVKLEEYKIIWEKSSEIKIKQKQSGDQRWDKLESQIDKRIHRQKYRKLLIQTLSVAASLFICFFIYFKSEKTITLIANKGEIVTSTLPDQSSVTINSKSVLSYSQSLFSNKRNVTLEGEAFFQVEKKRKRFVVSSDYGKIEVLGTKFNVKNRNSEIKVSCQEGSVHVMNKDIIEQSVILKKGFATKFDIKSTPLKPYQINPLEINGWTKGIIVFNQTPVIEVLNELERTFNISINKNNINPDITYNGEFDNMEISDILEIIALTLDLKLSKIDDTNYAIE